MTEHSDRLRTGPGEGVPRGVGPDSRSEVQASVGSPSAMTLDESQPQPTRPVQPSAYPQPDMSEAGRLRAIRNAPEAEPCACGGFVVAVRSDPGPGVRAHNREAVHQEWRLRGGFYQ